MQVLQCSPRGMHLIPDAGYIEDTSSFSHSHAHPKHSKVQEREIMQTGKSAMASMKEKAENVAASAKSGMEKTKATVQEKVEKMTSRNPAEKEVAEERKEERKAAAEAEKRAEQERNRAEKGQTRSGAVSGYPSGMTGVTTGHHHTTTTGHTTGTTTTTTDPYDPYYGAGQHGTGARYT